MRIRGIRGPRQAGGHAGGVQPVSVPLLLLGYALVKCECEPAPLLLGFVLGPMLEEHLRRAMIISKGDATVFFTRPLSLALLVLALGVLVVVLLPTVAKKREQVFVEED